MNKSTMLVLGSLMGLGLVTGVILTSHHSKPVARRHTSIHRDAISRFYRKSSSTSLLENLRRANQHETQQVMQTIDPSYPALRQTKGFITPTMAEVSLTDFTPHPPVVTGTHALWRMLRTSLAHPPARILSHPLPASVWIAGWQQAEDDVMTVLGNDPIAVLSHAGPGAAPAFAQLERIAYTGSGDEIRGHHWAVSMIASLSPHVTFYPPAKPIAGEPPTLVQMRVPVTVTEYMAIANPGNTKRTVAFTALQTGVALMVLTQDRGRYHWWVDALSTTSPQPITFPAH